MARLIGFNTIENAKAPFRVEGAQCVLRDLQNELYTQKGERPMRPNFGCIIWDLLMDPADSNVEKLAKEDIQRILRCGSGAWSEKHPSPAYIKSMLKLSVHIFKKASFN